MKIIFYSVAWLFLAGCSWTELVGVSSSGAQGNGTEDAATVSADGRFVAFHSSSSRLVPNDTNRNFDVFVRDTFNKTTTRVSVDSSGNQSFGGKSSNASISNDGRYVAFQSVAVNLVPDDTNGVRDVFVHDRENGTTIRASVNDLGTQGNGRSQGPAISGDGRYVAFYSTAENLVIGSPSNDYHIFVHDTVDRTTRRITADRSHSSYSPSISDDGRYIAFRSLSSSHVPNDNNREYDIFLHDVVTAATTRVSVSSEGVGPIGNSALGGTAGVEAALSADGRYVAFASSASNLVANDSNADFDIFLHDTADGTTARVSVSSTGEQATGGSSLWPSISGNGRYIAFSSGATNLVANDINELPDIFVHDTREGSTRRVSLSKWDVEAIDGGSFRPAIADNGKYVVFNTAASNLVANDANNQPDLVIKAVSHVTLTSVTPNDLRAGESNLVTIRGAGFLPGASLIVGGATASDIAIVDETTMTANLSVLAETAPGPALIIVTVPGTGPGDGASVSAMCTECILVQ